MIVRGSPNQRVFIDNAHLPPDSSSPLLPAAATLDAECPPERMCRAAIEAFLAESRTAHISEWNMDRVGLRAATQL